jgi:hypothetical protein
LLSWRHALREGVGDDLAIEGALQAQATLSGWPMRIEELTLAGAGATVRAAALPGPIRVGPIVTEWANGTLKLRPVRVFLPVAALAAAPARSNALLDSPPSSSALLVEGAIGPLPEIGALQDARYVLSVSGAARRAQDLLAIYRAWSGAAGPSWTAEGPVSLQLAWAGSLRSGASAARGTIQARGVQLTSALLNRPLLVSAAALDLRGDQRRINLQSVQALGTRWSGSLRSAAENGAWEFDLSADHLDAADFYAWLGPPARPNLLQRMLPFGSPAQSSESALRAGALETLQARGRLRVAEFRFAPLRAEKIDAAAALDGGALILRQGRADFSGGQLSGNFEARLSPQPSYSFDGQFSRVDLREVAALAALPGRAGGWASSELKLTARGADRAALAASLQGQGLLRAREASYQPIEQASAGNVTAAAEPDSGPFTLTARFQLADRRVRLEQVLLARPGEQTDISGTVDFARRLDLRVRSLPREPAAMLTAVAPPESWAVAGTLDAPRITSVPAPTPAPASPLANRTGVPAASASR